MRYAEILQKYLQYFESKNHTIIPSAPLVPEDDTTVLQIHCPMFTTDLNCRMSISVMQAGERTDEKINCTLIDHWYGGVCFCAK